MRGIEKLKSLYRGLNAERQVLLQKYPYRVQCNVCGWKGRHLSSDSWHPYATCPRCGSGVRHRLLFAALDTNSGLGFKTLIQGKRILHFAPEPLIAQYLVERAARYVSADFFRDDVDMRMDMSDMRDIADGSFDLVVACDVLEHIPDDSAALHEIHRVLAVSGSALLTAPQKDNLAATYCDDTVTTAEGRHDAFGQEDHLRIYGDDFQQFLRAHGFVVTIVDESSFDAGLVRKHVLFPPILSTHPLASNHRKVYFAQKRL
jgi:SAM-dependent methyltransferase